MMLFLTLCVVLNGLLVVTDDHVSKRVVLSAVHWSDWFFTETGKLMCLSVLISQLTNFIISILRLSRIQYLFANLTLSLVQVTVMWFIWHSRTLSR